jgi:hypothetical protein
VLALNTERSSCHPYVSYDTEVSSSPPPSSSWQFVNSWSHTACLLILADMLTKDPARHERTLTEWCKSPLTRTFRCPNQRQVTFASSRTIQQNLTLSDTYYTTESFLFVFSTTEIPSRSGQIILYIQLRTWGGGSQQIIFMFLKKIRPRNGTQYRSSQ